MAYIGYATSEGTKRFTDKAISNCGMPGLHFKNCLNLTLSQFGLGTSMDCSIEIPQMIDAVYSSLSNGSMNLIDTAINYGNQRAEKAIGLALERLFVSGISRDELFIASKGGYLAYGEQTPESYVEYLNSTFITTGVFRKNDIADLEHCMVPEFLDYQLNQSLENLKLETLDLLYLHNAAEAHLPYLGMKKFVERLLRVFEFYEEARRKGKIRYYGLASWDCFLSHQNKTHYLSLELVVKLAEFVGGENHGLKFIQLPYNIVLSNASTLKNQPFNGDDYSLLEVAHRLNINVLTSVPLIQGGFENNAFECLDHIRMNPYILACLIGQKKIEHIQENAQIAKTLFALQN